MCKQNINEKEDKSVLDYDGESYLTATEVAQRFMISRSTCYANVLCHVAKCYLPGRKNALYKQSEVEQFARVRIQAISCSKIPASAEEAETGSIVQ